MRKSGFVIKILKLDKKEMKKKERGIEKVREREKCEVGKLFTAKGQWKEFTTDRSGILQGYRRKDTPLPPFSIETVSIDEWFLLYEDDFF